MVLFLCCQMSVKFYIICYNFDLIQFLVFDFFMKSVFLDCIYSFDCLVLVFDGVMGINLQVQNLMVVDFGGVEYEGCNEYLVYIKLEVVVMVYCVFYEVGVDVVEMDIFGGMFLVLVEYDLVD